MTLNHELNKIRIKIISRQLLVSLSYAVIMFVLLCFATSWFDLRYPLQERTAFWLVIGYLLFATIWFSLKLIKAFKTPHVVDLAKLIEKRHPEYDNKLICAVEKEQLPQSERTLFEQLLIDEVCQGEYADSFAKDLLTQKQSHFWIYLMLFLAAYGLAQTMKTARTFHKSVFYRSQNKTIVTKPDKIFAEKGKDFTITSEVFRWEQAAEVEFLENGELVRYPMQAKGPYFTFTFYGVEEDFEFQVISPSLTSEKYQVTTFIRPKYKKETITITPPKYTGVEPFVMNEFSSFSIIEGSKLLVEFDVIPVEANASFIYNKIELESTLENDHFTAEFIPSINGKYQAKVVDESGFSKRSKIEQIELIPDMAPVISIVTPEDNVKAKTDESVEINAIAADDFGIATVMLHVDYGDQQTKYEIFNGKDERTSEESLTSIIDISKLPVKSGEVVKYYMTVYDNKEPKAQVAQSEIRFIDIYNPYEKEKMKGQSGKKKEMKVGPLLAEMKRLIRLSHSSYILKGEDYTKQLNELSKSLSDLRLNMTKTYKEILESGAPETDPLMIEFQNALKLAQGSENLMREKKLGESIKSQTAALSILGKIFYELSKKQPEMEPDDKKSQCDKSGGKSGKGSPKQQKKMNIKATLKKLKEMLQNIQQQTDKQSALNNQLNAFNGQKIPTTEKEQLQRSQEKIESELAKLLDKIKDSEPMQPLSEKLSSINSSTQSSQEAIKQGNSSLAYKSGVLAKNKMLQASSMLQNTINKFIANQVKQMGQAAKQMSKSMSDIAKKSGENPTKASEKQALKDQQKGNQAGLTGLKKDLKEMRSELETLFPEAAKSLDDAIRKLQKDNPESSLKRAETGMKINRFKLASKYQKKAADALNRLSSNIAKASDKLPLMSSQQLLEEMQKLNQQQKESSSAAKNGKVKEMQEQLKRMKENMDQLSRALKSQKLTEIGTQLSMLPTVSSENLKQIGEFTNKVLLEAQSELRRELIKSQLKKKIEFNRKSSTPPEKYRNLIDQYFKSLSE